MPGRSFRARHILSPAAVAAQPASKTIVCAGCKYSPVFFPRGLQVQPAPVGNNKRWPSPTFL